MSINLPPNSSNNGSGNRPQGATSSAEGDSAKSTRASSANAVLTRLSGEVREAKVSDRQTLAQYASARSEQIKASVTARQQEAVKRNIEALTRLSPSTETGWAASVKAATAGSGAQQATALQNLFVTTLQIGSTQVDVLTKQRLPVGAELLLKVIDAKQLQLLETLLPNAGNNTGPIKPGTIDPLLLQQLRSLLPKQDQNLNLIARIKTLPASIVQTLPAPISTLLNQLLQTQLNPQSITAQQIRQAVQSSGVFLEARSQQTSSQLLQNLLAQLYANSVAKKDSLQQPIATNTPTTVNASSAKASPQIASANTKKLPSIIRQSIQNFQSERTALTKKSNALSLDTKATLNPASTGDTKQNLANGKALQPQILSNATRATQPTIADTKDVKLLSTALAAEALKSLMALAVQPTQTAPLATGITSGFAEDISALLKQAAQQLRQQNTGGETRVLATTQRDQAQILLMLLRESLATLARTQLHQLNTLVSQQQNAETPTTQQWFSEIPININQHQQSVELNTEEQNANQGEQSAQRQWQVMMQFDLERLGALYVKLVLCGETVKATLWTETSTTQRFGF